MITNRLASVESLEIRRMLTVSPTTLATFPNGIGPQVIGSGELFATTPSTNSSAGTIVDIDLVDGYSPYPVANFGPNGASNTLGIDPHDLIAGVGGPLFGDTESGGADGDGTLWEGSPFGPMQLLTPLNFSGVHGLARDNQGVLFGMGTQNGKPLVFAFTSSTGIFAIGSSSPDATPVAAIPDSTGNVFILYNNSAGSFITELPAGNYNSSGTTFNPFAGLGDVHATGVAIDGSNNLFFTVTGAKDAIVEIASGSMTASILGTWTSSTVPALEDPVLGPNDVVFATAFNPDAPSSNAALLLLPPQQSTFRTVSGLTSADEISGLYDDYEGSAGDLYGVAGNSIIEFSGNGLSALEAAPVVVASPVTGIGTNIAIDSAGNLFYGSPSTNTSGGSLYEILAGSSTPQLLASFGPGDSANTLGIGPHDILVNTKGDLYGDCETGGAGGSGTLWELPKGGKALTLLSDLSFGSVANLTMDAQGDLFGIGNTFVVANPAIIVAFEWTHAAGLQIFDGGEGGGGIAQPTWIASDAAGNVFVLNSDPPDTGNLAIAPAGSYAMTPSTFDPYPEFDTSVFNGIAVAPNDDLYLSTDSGLLELKAGARTTTQVATLPSIYAGSAYSGLGGPIIDATGDIYASARGASVSAILELPAGSSTFKTILSLPTSDDVDDLTPDPKGDFFGIVDNSIVEYPAIGFAALPTPASTTIGLSPVITKAIVPSAVAANARFGGAVRLQITPLQSGATAGITTTTVYAVSATETIKLGQLKQRYKTGVKTLAGTIRFATKLPTGNYSLIAQTIDVNGNTVDSSVGGTVTVAAPYTDVSAVIATITSKIAVNHTGVAQVVLSCTGNVPATGTLTLTINTGGYNLASETIKLKGLTSRRLIRVRVKIPSAMPAGSYTPQITATWNGTAQTATAAVSFQVL